MERTDFFKSSTVAAVAALVGGFEIIPPGRYSADPLNGKVQFCAIASFEKPWEDQPFILEVDDELFTHIKQLMIAEVRRVHGSIMAEFMTSGQWLVAQGRSMDDPLDQITKVGAKWFMRE